MATKTINASNKNEFAGLKRPAIIDILKGINPDLTSTGKNEEIIARIHRARTGTTTAFDYLKGKAPGAIKVASGSALPKPAQVEQEVWDSNQRLRTACKALGFPAVGKTPELQQKLYDHYAGKEVAKKSTPSPKSGKSYADIKADITALNGELPSDARLTLRGDAASLSRRHAEAIKYFKKHDKTANLTKDDFIKNKCPADILNRADEAEDEETKEEAPETTEVDSI